MFSPSNSDSSQPGLLRSLVSSGLWRFFPFLLVYIIGIAILYPVLPSIVTNGFASAAAGHPVNCEVSQRMASNGC